MKNLSIFKKYNDCNKLSASGHCDHVKYYAQIY